MRFYAVPSWRLARQIAADLFVLVWMIAWWLAGRAIDAAIRVLADPARQGAELVDGLQDQLTQAAELAGQLPVAGTGLRQPLDDMAASADALAAQAYDQAAAFESVATAAGWLVFLVPVFLMLALWLPPRVRFALRTRDIANLGAVPHGDDLLALRALATQPLRALTTVADDPVTAWRAGDATAIGRLADLERARAGVRVTPPAGGPPTRPAPPGGR